jgi:hypothetical protein
MLPIGSCIRLVWRPRSRNILGLQATAIALSLPPERVEAFITTLLGAQDRWAFNRPDARADLAEFAALASMERPLFETALGDTALLRASWSRGSSRICATR